MSRAWRFTKAEIERAAAVVVEKGVAVRLGRDGSILVIPDTHSLAQLDPRKDDDLDAELAAFEAKHGHGRT